MPDIFVSYSRKNKALADSLVSALKARGREAWLDREDIQYGDLWWNTIQQGIQSADNFVLIGTPDALCSPVCHLEIECARAHNKRLLPMIQIEPNMNAAFTALAAFNPEEFLEQVLAGRQVVAIAAENWVALSARNWLRFKDSAEFAAQIDELLAAISTDQDYTRQHTDLLERTHRWESEKRNPGFLLQGKELDEAEDWLADATRTRADGTTVSKEPAPTKAQREYITISRRAARLQQRNRLAAAVVGLLVVVVLLAGALLAFSRSEYERARADSAGTLIATAATVVSSERDRADRGATAVAQQLSLSESRRLALAAEKQTVKGTDPELAALLGIRALQLAYTPEADIALTNALHYLYTQDRFVDGSGAVKAVTASPDGTMIATGSGGTITLRRGTESLQFTQHAAAITSVSFVGPNLVLSSSMNGVVMLWNARTQAILWKEKAGDRVRSAARSPDGTTILTGGTVLTAWTVQGSQSSQSRQLSGHTGDVWSVAYSPDGAAALTCGDKGVILLWDTRSMEARPVDGAGTGTVFACAFAPDGKSFAASADNGKKLLLWNREDLKPRTLVENKFRTINAIGFSPDGDRIATANVDFGGSDNTARIIRLSDGREIGTYWGHTKGVTSAAFFRTNSGDRLLTGSDDGTARVWASAATWSRIDFPSSEKTFVRDLALSPDGKLLVTCDETPLIMVWDAQTGAPLGRYRKTEGNCLGVAYSPVNASFITGDNRGRLERWRSNSVEPELLYQHPISVTGVKLSPDGKSLLAFMNDGSLMLHSAVNQFRTPDKLVLPGGAAIHTAAFAPDSQTLALGREDSSLWLWSARDGLVSFAQEKDAINDVAFAPKGDSLLVGTAKGEAVLWDVASRRPIWRIVVSDLDVWSVELSPDNAFTVDDDGTLSVWNLKTQKLRRRFKAHDASSLEIVLSADYRTVYTGGDDGFARAWDVDYTDLITTVCRRVFFREFTTEERGLFFINDTSPVCPRAAP